MNNIADFSAKGLGSYLGLTTGGAAVGGVAGNKLGTHIAEKVRANSSEDDFSTKEASVIANEILKSAGLFLDPETKESARAAREASYQDPEDYLSAIELLAYNDYQKKKNNPETYSGPFRTGSEASFKLNNLLEQIRKNPEYKGIERTIDRDINAALLGSFLGLTAGAVGGGALGGKVNQRAAQKASPYINKVPLEFSQLGAILGGINGTVAGAALGQRTMTPTMAKLDPEKIQEYLSTRDGAPHATLKEL